MYQSLKIVEKSDRLVQKLKRVAFNRGFQMMILTVVVACFPGTLAVILKCMPVPVQMIAALCTGEYPVLAAAFALPHLFTIPIIANGIGKAVSKFKYTWGTAAREATETLINTSHIVGLIVESMMDIAQIGALLTTGTAYKDGDTLLGMIPYRNTGCASSLLEDMLKAMAVPTYLNPYKPELGRDFPTDPQAGTYFKGLRRAGRATVDLVSSIPMYGMGYTEQARLPPASSHDEGYWEAVKRVASNFASTVKAAGEIAADTAMDSTRLLYGSNLAEGAGAGAGAGDPDMDPTSYAWYGDLPKGRGGRRHRRHRRQIVPFSEYHMYL
jgi:hypothetical protein